MPGAVAQDLARLVLVEEFLELDVDRLGMADEDRHADAGGRDLDLRVHDLLGLGDHLPFFLGRPVLHELVDMGNDVEGDLLGELLGVPFLTGDIHALGLVPQLIHAVLAGAGHGLVGGDDDALDLCAVMQRLQRHDHLRGGAVGVGDDVLAFPGCSLLAASPAGDMSREQARSDGSFHRFHLGAFGGADSRARTAGEGGGGSSGNVGHKQHHLMDRARVSIGWLAFSSFR
jgi:hypothetical protein